VSVVVLLLAATAAVGGYAWRQRKPPAPVFRGLMVGLTLDGVAVKPTYVIERPPVRPVRPARGRAVITYGGPSALTTPNTEDLRADADEWFRQSGIAPVQMESTPEGYVANGAAIGGGLELDEDECTSGPVTQYYLSCRLREPSYDSTGVRIGTEEIWHEEAVGTAPNKTERTVIRKQARRLLNLFLQMYRQQNMPPGKRINVGGISASP
jgi:hypothetical protein